MAQKPLTHDRIFDDPSFAARYAEKHRAMADAFGKEYTRKLRLRGIESGDVLDAGCGFGGTSLALATALPACRVIGIDLAEPLLAIAREERRVAGLEDRVEFRRADVQDLPFDTDVFAAVLSINMVHIVERPVDMLHELERVLRPDGALFIADLRRSWLGIAEKAIGSAYSSTEARRLLASAALRSGTFSTSLLWWRYESCRPST